MKKHLLIFILLFSTVYSVAQDTLQVGEDDGYYSYFEVTPSNAETWRSDRSFAYMNYLDSLLRDMQKPVPLEDQKQEKKNENNWFSDLLNSDWLGWIGWLLAFLLVGSVLYRFFSTEGVFMKQRKLNAVEVPEDAVHEEVKADADFDALKAQAMRSGNHRLAIKYAYVQLLYQLQLKGHIHLQPGKTNQDYLRTLPQDLRKSFTPLLHVYEYVWYGEKTPDVAAAENILHHFNQFREKL